jgi:DNA-binding phage protein
MVDINKLKGKIIEKKLNVSRLAVKIGINQATLYRKLKTNGDYFSIKEAELIAKELDLTVDELNSIFFSGFTKQTQKKKGDMI